MKYFFAYYILASFVLAAYFALQTYRTHDKGYPSDKLVTVCCIGSAIWSLGFGSLILQTDPKLAYYCRCVGMVGVFVFLIAAQILVCEISQIQTKLRRWFNGFSFLGVPIYFLTILPDATVYELTDWGMTYYFKSGLPNALYTLYSVILGLHILIVVVYMIKKSPVRRIQKFGRQFLPTVFLVLGGMVLDTIFPLLGLAAIPGSTMTQFVGLAMLIRAVHANSLSRINTTNMSNYLYSSLAMPVLVCDGSYALRIVNDAGQEFFEEQDYVRKPIADLFDCDADDIFSFEGNSHTLDTTCKGKKVHCRLDVSQIRDHYGDLIGYIIIVTDQSERVRTMKNLEDARQEAEFANRSKSRFLANMSHEIRTPMNAILGFSDLLLEEHPQGKMLDYIQDIKCSSINLLTIINDILDISKIESGRIEIVEAAYLTPKLLDDVGQIIQMQASNKNLRYRLTVDEDVPGKLRGDATRIRSILINLLNNAVKYTDEGEIRLHVSVKKHYGEQALLEFAVSDTGIGIRKEELGKLFDRFARADIQRNYQVEGSGLGLSIVKNSVAIMGGQVTVDSVYGRGTTFTVTMPQRVVDARPYRVCMEEMKAQETAKKRVRPQFSDLTVLAVDDNIINLKVVSRNLESYGLTVDAVSTGREAVRRCAYKYYPLIFMDQMMPQMDGIEAMKRIRGENDYYAPGGEGKIIVLTANALSGVREELLKEGFDAYLEKPMNLEALEDVLVKFLH